MYISKTRFPMIPLRGMTVLPGGIVHFDVGKDKSVKAVEKAMTDDQLIFVSLQKNPEDEDPGEDDIFRIGCIVKVRQVIKLHKNISRVLVSGESRGRMSSLITEGEYIEADVEYMEENPEDVEGLLKERGLNEERLCRTLKDSFYEFYVKKEKNVKYVVEQIEDLESLPQLLDRIAGYLSLSHTQSQSVLEEMDVMRRYELVYFLIADGIRVAEFKEELNSKIKARVDEKQREYILREEMRVITEELGDGNAGSDAEEFQDQLKKLKAPKEVQEKIGKEISRFVKSSGSPAESAVIRTYIETMLEMPWEKKCRENNDLSNARGILDRDHYGLEKVKERILEFLAVRILTKKAETPIVCLVGPPGTGKTSIAKSLSAALGRPYVRISLGGVRDEAEIRGHRKTYVGAMPGRIAAGIKNAGVKNPLMLLDEIDKVSNDYKGDTFSALLEVLDNEQNVKFRDHYLEVPLDLSEVLFITTANSLQTIPRPLIDRMEIIEVSSYTENEKIHIAEDHLVPKQLKRHGLDEARLRFSRNALWKMARNYTREAGVRQLERKIAEVCRKTAREILEDKTASVHLTDRNIEKYLGKKTYKFHMKNDADEIGIVRGLAWTSVGGDTLQIEVNTMPGDGEVQLTGKLGDVMKESAKAAITYIRSIEGRRRIKSDYFKEHDIHIHIPEGAVPKDGPSAGITIATAIFSAVTKTKVRADLAMTGEITLRGRVLPIGGLKEKLLAAKNAGIATVLIPSGNLSDMEEMSQEITRGMEIIGVDQLDEVLEYALSKRTGRVSRHDY